MISVSPFKKPEEAKGLSRGRNPCPCVRDKAGGRRVFLYRTVQTSFTGAGTPDLLQLLCDDYPVKRNPVNGADTFAPLAKTKMEAFCNGRFLPVENWRDGTYQFLENGDCPSFSLRRWRPGRKDCTGFG